jgi:endonuclease/exonuclease/phosphatase family metal-dependent hydrolase
MPLKLISLNIEGNRHIEKVILFLKKENADVVCLQEVFIDGFESIKGELKTKGKFFPLTNNTDPSKKCQIGNGLKGMAIFTKLPNSGMNFKLYKGEGKTPEQAHANSGDRGIAYAEFEKDDKNFTIGTTHFTWTADSEANDEQRKNFSKLMHIVKAFPHFILCGDFNAPRGKEIFSKFTKFFVDNIPPEVNTTLDPKHHRAPHLRYVVDSIFSTSPYEVSNVRIVDDISDHKAIIGEIDIIMD